MPRTIAIYINPHQTLTFHTYNISISTFFHHVDLLRLRINYSRDDNHVYKTKILKKKTNNHRLLNDHSQLTVAVTEIWITLLSILL